VYLGNISALQNKHDNSKKYFDTALKKIKTELEANPKDADLISLKGLAHAGKGEKTEAISEGKKAVSSAQKINDKILVSEMTLNLAKIYSILGMNSEAIEQIEEVLKNPSLFSVKVLKHDPVWKPLLNEEKLIAITKKYDKILTL
jgi:tetratricopeptide (TPR) repeat protein